MKIIRGRSGGSGGCGCGCIVSIGGKRKIGGSDIALVSTYSSVGEIERKAIPGR